MCVVLSWKFKAIGRRSLFTVVETKLYIVVILCLSACRPPNDEILMKQEKASTNKPLQTLCPCD